MEGSSVNGIKKIALFVFFILSTACGSSTHGLDELKRLCEKDAGLTIYKTVEADGYYDDTTQCHHCWHGLINGPFEYVEFCDHESKRHPLTYILKEHGCYRLSKVKRDSGQCHVEVDKDIAKRIIEPFVSFKEEQCISVEKIAKPESRYKYTVDSEELWIDKQRGVLIRKGNMRIEEINDGRLIAENISYSLTPGGAGTPQSKSNIGCDSIHITGQKSSKYEGSADHVFINSVLVNK